MSQPKNETVVLVLALLVTMGLGGVGIWLFGNIFSSNKAATQNQEGVTTLTNKLTPAQISLGEKSLLPGASPAKQEGIEAIAQGDYAKAIVSLQTSLQKQKNDPEALIY